MAVRKRVVVRGHVQGVFFRDSTQRRAAELGVGGWVRNCSDGSVEALFEGDADAVEQAVSFMRDGPERARVESVDVTDEDPHGDASSFDVR
jgi:acylphosphatase